MRNNVLITTPWVKKQTNTETSSPWQRQYARLSYDQYNLQILSIVKYFNIDAQTF